MMKKKILIVDDDYDIVEPLSLLLETENYQVSTLIKGEKIYAEVQVYQPDIILLDILMSGSDGRVICKKLKQQKETQHIPIILMSAHPTVKSDALRSKADNFIAKPFEIDTLLNMITRTLH